MATNIPLAPVREGHAWLLSCAPDPAAVQRAWDAQQLAPIPTGPHWLVGEAQLSRSLDAARRLGSRPLGPVLTDVRTSLAWWLLPPGQAGNLDGVAGITVHPPGWKLHCPPVVHSLAHRWWLALPDGTGHLTDPILLAAAFGPGGYRTDTGAPA